MNKQVFKFVLSSTLSLAVASGIACQTVGAAPSSSSTTASGTTKAGAAHIPKKMAGFVVGAFVGMPICMVRRIVDENKDGVKGLVGDSDNKFSQVAAGTFWLPFSIVLGTVEAPVYGPLNSLLNVNEPFSKNQLALGDHLLGNSGQGSTPPAQTTAPAVSDPNNNTVDSKAAPAGAGDSQNDKAGNMH